MSVLDRTEIGRYERLSIDSLLDAITSNRKTIAKLKVLQERTEKGESEKIDDIMLDIKEHNVELFRIKNEIEKMGMQPTMLPMKFKDKTELDRKTSTESLIKLTSSPLYGSRRNIERAKGNMRGLRSRVREEERMEYMRMIERDLDKLDYISTDLYRKIGVVGGIKPIKKMRTI